MSGMILPGARIGCLGGGQLGAMLGREARRLGYGFHVLDAVAGGPASRVADSEIVSGWEDLEALAEFASRVDVVTLEFENVPAAAARYLADRVPVLPDPEILAVAQNRIREKEFLERHGIPMADFRVASNAAELVSALRELDVPAVVKTADLGYDGRGQWKISDPRGEPPNGVGPFPVVVEVLVDLACELSVIAARNRRGECVTYEPFLNAHSDHILESTICPSGLPEALRVQAREIAEAIADQINLAGVICVEFFVTGGGRLLVNELAPRPHNSGHLTLDAHETSQFEQQLRTVCNLPLGSTRQVMPAAMVNLLGDLWSSGPPPFDRVLALPGLFLHLYGKSESRPRRKMGHLTALAVTSEEALGLVRSARRLLEGRDDPVESPLRRAS